MSRAVPKFLLACMLDGSISSNTPLFIEQIGDSGEAEGPPPIMGCPLEAAAECHNLTIPAIAIAASDARRLSSVLSAAASGEGPAVTGRAYLRQRPMLDVSFIHHTAALSHILSSAS